MTSIEEQAAKTDFESKSVFDNQSRLSFGPATSRRSLYMPTESYTAGVSITAHQPMSMSGVSSMALSSGPYRKDSIDSNFTSVSQRKSVYNNNDLNATNPYLNAPSIISKRSDMTKASHHSNSNNNKNNASTTRSQVTYLSNSNVNKNDTFKSSAQSQVSYNKSVLNKSHFSYNDFIQNNTNKSQSPRVSNRIALDLMSLAKDKPFDIPSVGNDGGLSQIEEHILRSLEPIDINETEEIEVLGQRGIWANKSEIANWRGELPINEYLINHDPNPEVITKKSKQNVEYIQELAIRYLRPPTPPAPGEILITQEQNILTPPAPPLIIRQQPARPITPEPLIIREAPPQAPKPIGRKIITISGKRIPPPPRKVVIERFAQLPSKPQSVLIERWLPYAEVKRRVIFQAAPPDPVVVKPRNMIVQWEAPSVEIRKEFKYLGVVNANPFEFVQTYGAQVRPWNQLPDFVFDIKNPDGVLLASEYQPSSFHELEGDLHALKLVNLEQEGLGEYKSYLTKMGVIDAQPTRSTVSFKDLISQAPDLGSITMSAEEESVDDEALHELITQIFQTIDTKNRGRITVEDAEKTLLRLNSRLGRNYGENDVRAFFGALDCNNDGTLELEEFKRAFLCITA